MKALEMYVVFFYFDFSRRAASNIHGKQLNVALQRVLLAFPGNSGHQLIQDTVRRGMYLHLDILFLLASMEKMIKLTK